MLDNRPEHIFTQLALYTLQATQEPVRIAFVGDRPGTGTQNVRKGLIFPDKSDPRDAPEVVDLRAYKKRRS